MPGEGLSFQFLNPMLKGLWRDLRKDSDSEQADYGSILLGREILLKDVYPEFVSKGQYMWGRHVNGMVLPEDLGVCMVRIDDESGEPVGVALVVGMNGVKRVGDFEVFEVSSENEFEPWEIEMALNIVAGDPFSLSTDSLSPYRSPAQQAAQVVKVS